MTPEEEKELADQCINAIVGACFRCLYGNQSKLTERALVNKVEECVWRLVAAKRPVKPIGQPNGVANANSR